MTRDQREAVSCTKGNTGGIGEDKDINYVHYYTYNVFLEQHQVEVLCFLYKHLKRAPLL